MKIKVLGTGCVKCKSLPEIIILKKVLKWQLIAVFVTVFALGIVLVGFIFNYLIFI
jgi:uncharacterized membrane protein YraQ (UPF0718 family)